MGDLYAFFFLTDDEYERLNPPELATMLMDDGIYFRDLDDEHWLPVGYIPCPKTRFGWFIYHLVHGLAMRYRFVPVLVYAFRHSLWSTRNHDAF